jgi:hypothetical protein
MDTKGYIPEAAELIRHTEPDTSRIKSTKEVLRYLEKITPAQEEKEISENAVDDFTVEIGTPQDEYLISNYEALINPLVQYQK